MSRLGFTFLLDDPAVDEHLEIVISDPTMDPNRIVTANFTSWKSYKDQSCIVEVGDHPFIRHRSCVDYRRDKVFDLAQFNRLLTAGLLHPQEDVSKDLLRRIHAGASISPHFPLGNRQILIDQGFIDAG